MMTADQCTALAVIATGIFLVFAAVYLVSAYYLLSWVGSCLFGGDHVE